MTEEDIDKVVEVIKNETNTGMVETDVGLKIEDEKVGTWEGWNVGKWEH